MNTSATGRTLRSAGAKNERAPPLTFTAVSGAVSNTGVVGQIPAVSAAAGGHATAARFVVHEDAVGESSSSPPPHNVLLPTPNEHATESSEHDSDEHDHESPRAPTTTPADGRTSIAIRHPIQNDPMLADEARRPSPPPTRMSSSWPSRRQPEASKPARRTSRMTGSGSKSAKTPMRRNISS